MHAFSKLDRFGVRIQRPINKSCYEVEDKFAIKKERSLGRGFGSSIPDRFGYYEHKKKPIEKA